MRVLLDTHALLWAIFEPQRLSKRARLLLGDTQTTLLVSSVSAWEIATKYRIGKLAVGEKLVASYSHYLARLAADELPINSAHALVAGAFASAHRDPFDRMLAAQSQLEALPLVSCDSVLREFGVELIW
jgi:PIN domain nuclease of toxin-antitoxin system